MASLRASWKSSEILKKMENLAKYARFNLHEACNSGWKSNGATAFGSLFSQGAVLGVRTPGRPGEQFCEVKSGSFRPFWNPVLGVFAAFERQIGSVPGQRSPQISQCARALPCPSDARQFPGWTPRSWPAPQSKTLKMRVFPYKNGLSPGRFQVPGLRIARNLVCEPPSPCRRQRTSVGRWTYGA